MSTVISPSSTSLFHFEESTFRYEPFPIGLTRPIFEPSLYDEMLDKWPAQELFAFMPKLGKKYSLSEVNEPANYREFVEGSAIWRRVHREIKSAAFVRAVLQLLRSQSIDLGV